MALRIYAFNGSTYQFDDQDVPAGAVEVRPHDVIRGELVPEVPEEKATTPKNKAAKPSNKAVEDGGKPSTAGAE